MQKDSRIDAYISKSAAFAQPVLTHLRELIHETCPDVTESVKWGMPAFDYKGPLCHIAAFKQHAVMGFWKAALMKDPVLMLEAKAETAMGHLGRITSLKDLPSDKKIKAWIREAMQLNEAGIKMPKKATEKPEIPVPDYFSAALKKNKKAGVVFAAFSASCRREYLEWITGAKTEPTREKRMAQAIEWMSEGKKINWKYEK